MAAGPPRPVRQPFRPTALHPTTPSPDSPFVRQLFHPTAPSSDSPLVRQPFRAVLTEGGRPRADRSFPSGALLRMPEPGERRRGCRAHRGGTLTPRPPLPRRLPAGPPGPSRFRLRFPRRRAPERHQGRDPDCGVTGKGSRQESRLWGHRGERVSRGSRTRAPGNHSSRGSRRWGHRGEEKPWDRGCWAS